MTKAPSSIEWQRQALAAHRASLDAVQRSLDAAGDLVRMRTAGQKVLDANLRALRSWASLWGWQ